MILVDTSAIYALAAQEDSVHSRAVAAMARAIEDDEELLIHSYIVSEAASLLQRRLGLAVLLAFLERMDSFTVHWLSAGDHAEAAKLLAARGRRQLSLVDCASFVVMRRYGITHAFAYDGDFEREGFTLYGG